MDFNGAFEYSNTIAVEFHKVKRAFDIYPNPSDGDFYISMSGETGDNIFVMIRNMLGEQLYIKGFVSENENLITPLNLSSILPQGTYVITAYGNDQSISKKIVVK